MVVFTYKKGVYMTYQIPTAIQTLLDSDDENFHDQNRQIACEELVKRLKETNCSLPEYNITADQFEFDGEMIIHCGEHKQWEIYLWADGVVEATTYFSGIFDGGGISLKDALLDPQLVMNNLKDLIDSFCDQRNKNFDELEYDPDGDWGCGAWVMDEDEDY